LTSIFRRVAAWSMAFAGAHDVPSLEDGSAFLQLSREQLQAALSIFECSLPFAPVEPAYIALVNIGHSVGFTEAPSFPPVSSLSIQPLAQRACRGRIATFALTQPRYAATELSTANTVVCTALASVALVKAMIELSGGTAVAESPIAATHPEQELPVSYEPSVAHGGVRIAVPVPASAPDGSRIVVRRLVVGGCEFSLGEAPLQVIVGYNHAPAVAGPVNTAVVSDDVPALMRALEGGASTEEEYVVSGEGRYLGNPAL
jgi:hypothetical protein